VRLTTTRPVPAPVARLALVALLTALAPAACSSSGGAKSDGSTEGGVERPTSDAAGDGAGDAPAADASDAGDAASDTDAPASDAAADAADANGAAGDALARGDGRPGDAGDALASSDGADSAPPCPTCSFYVTYTFGGEQESVVAAPIIRYSASYALDIFNGSDQPVSLADVRIRYWFTNDGTSWQWSCTSNCAGVLGPNFVGISPRSGADTYLEIGFASDRLDAFSDTGPIPQDLSAEVSIFGLTSVPTVRNDYSFTTDGMTPDQHVTIYVAGKLVWGTEP